MLNQIFAMIANEDKYKLFSDSSPHPISTVFGTISNKEDPYEIHEAFKLYFTRIVENSGENTLFYKESLRIFKGIENILNNSEYYIRRAEQPQPVSVSETPVYDNRIPPYKSGGGVKNEHIINNEQVYYVPPDNNTNYESVYTDNNIVTNGDNNTVMNNNTNKRIIDDSEVDGIYVDKVVRVEPKYEGDFENIFLDESCELFQGGDLPDFIEIYLESLRRFTKDIEINKLHQHVEYLERDEEEGETI